jgi:archaellum component FlaC
MSTRKKKKKKKKKAVTKKTLFVATMKSFLDWKRIEEVLKDFKKVVVKRDSAKSALNAQKDAIAKQKVAVAEQNDAVAEQNDAVAEQTKRVKAQQARVDDQQEIVDENVKRAGKAKAELVRLKNELKDDETKLVQLKNELKDAKIELKDAKIELEKLEAKLNSAEVAVARVAKEHQTVLQEFNLNKDATVNDVATKLATVADDIANALRGSNCFWFLQADDVDDLTGYRHRCGTLDFDVYTRLDSRTRPDPRTRLDSLLRAARVKHDCPLPDPDLLLERVGKRVNDVKAALSALPSSKTIRDELYAIADDENFLANVIAAMSQGAIRNKADLGDLLRRMRSYVVGAAELVLNEIPVPHTEMTLRMQCAALTSSLGLLKTKFGAEVDSTAIQSAVEEWKLGNANHDDELRRLVLFANTAIDKTLADSANAASVLVFTTMQVGFERTTHVTAVFACGGLVRFQLCHFDNISRLDRTSFIALVSSICQIYEYERMRDTDELKALFDPAVPEAVEPAPSTPTTSAAALQPWEGPPRPANAVLPNSLPTPTKCQTLQRIDPAAECALMTELRAGTTTQRNDDRVVVVGDKRVFKMLRVTRHNGNDVFREIQLLSLANRAAPLHVVAAEHAFSATQYQWPCAFAAIGAIDIVALVMPRLAPLEWSALDLAEFARYGGQLCEALAALHAGLIVHFDVKPCNIAIDAAARQLKLLDFGLSELHVGDRTAVVPARGTKAFMAPEVEEAWLSGAKRAFSPAVDVYSAGITLRASSHAASCAPASELIAQMTAVRALERVTARRAATLWHETVERQTKSTKKAAIIEKSKKADSTKVKSKSKGMELTGADKENQSQALVAQFE